MILFQLFFFPYAAVIIISPNNKQSQRSLSGWLHFTWRKRTHMVPELGDKPLLVTDYVTYGVLQANLLE